MDMVPSNTLNLLQAWRGTLWLMWDATTRGHEMHEKCKGASGPNLVGIAGRLRWLLEQLLCHHR